MNYVDKMMGDGYAAAHGVTNTLSDSTINFAGTWDPIVWLLLLFCVTCAVALVAILGSNKKIGTLEMPAEIAEADQVAPADAKYEPFLLRWKKAFILRLAAPICSGASSIT